MGIERWLKDMKWAFYSQQVKQRHNHTHGNIWVPSASENKAEEISAE